MEVKSTKDYDSFKFLGQNRDLSARKNINHIKDLAQSIKENGFIKPILVNEKMEIIDGQHRIEAARLVGSEVLYLKGENISDNIISQLNTHQLNWGIKDFMHYYIEKGNENYARAEEFVKQYEFPIAESVGLLKGTRGGSSGKRNKEFKDGSFTVNEKAVDWAYNVAGEVQDIRDFDDSYKAFRNSTRFVSALISFVSFPDYKHKIMMDRLSKMRTRLVQCASKSEYIDVFESIYNFGMKKNFLHTREA